MFLFIGDPHIKPDNGDAIAILLREIDSITTPFDAIIVAGDVMHYHERLFTPALNLALSFLDHLRKIAPTYVLVGNHDAINNSIFLTDQHWMNALKDWDNLVIVDRVLVVGDSIMCPYVPPGRFQEALETAATKEEWLSKKVIFAHQEFKGCKMGAITSVDGDHWENDWPLVISGHIHDNQRVGSAIYYPGAPLQHSFGDTDTRVVCLVDVATQRVTDIPLNVPKKRMVKTETLQELGEAMTKIMAMHTGQTKVKVKAELSTEEFSLFKKTEQYRVLTEKGVKIQVIRKTEERETRQGGSFASILKEMIEEDEPIVVSLYEEVILEKMIIFSQ